MSVSLDLAWRGLIKDRTFADLDWLDKPKAFYLGIDASAASLTVGNLAVLTLVRRLIEAGWQAHLIMGGGTTLIGDPGGKAEERQLLSREAVQKNTQGVRAQVGRVLQQQPHQVLDNYDWLANLTYVDFLRDVGKHFSMTELMQRDFVAERMGAGGSGISYAEFSYSLLQGYDFWYLFKHYGVVLQIGGSDQWGNLLSGVSLIRKKEGQEVHAMSMPLVVNKSTGRKFGKTEGGAVWLDAKLTPPAEFYQFWLNTDDAGVIDYLKIYTRLDRPDIESVAKEHAKNPAARTAQHRLAYETTWLVHGEAAAQAAREHARALSVGRPAGDSLGLEAAPGDDVVELLLAAGLVKSKTEGRQLLASGGVYINDQPATKTKLAASDFAGGVLKLRRGKKLRHTAFFAPKAKP